MADEKDPFETLVIEEDLDGFAALSARSVAAPEAAAPPVPAASTARLQGFDLEERPLLSGVPGLPGEVVAARTTVPLQRADRGAAVVVVFEDGDARRPIVLGVLQEQRPHGHAAPAQPRVSVQADEERLVLSAEREVVLRCGDASITLTRAGKVLIKGAYVLSRSSGYNRIKGAAVDIN